MEITPEPREHYSVLFLRGEFDTFYCHLLQDEVEALMASGETRVVLDLRGVRFINSTALGAIVRSSKLLARRGGRLVIARPSEFARTVIEKVALHRIIPVCDTEDEAAEAVRAEPSAATPAPAAEPEDPSVLLFTLPDRKPAVGRMLALDAAGLSFAFSGEEEAAALVPGAELTVKFRLPLYGKGRYQAVVTVTAVEQREDDRKVSAAFTRIDADARRATQQYAEDMAYLKRELGRAED